MVAQNSEKRKLVFEDIVSPRVYTLRKLLTAGGERNVILCERGKGYALRASREGAA